MSEANWRLHNAECNLDDLHEDIEYLNLSDEDKQICYSGIAMVSGILARNKDRLEEEAELEDEEYNAVVSALEEISHHQSQIEIQAESDAEDRRKRVEVIVNKSKQPKPGTYEAYMSSKAKESSYEC